MQELKDQLTEQRNQNDAAEAALYLRAVETLRRTNGKVTEAALREFATKAVLNKAAIDALAKRFLIIVAQDMNGDARAGHGPNAQTARRALPPSRHQPERLAAGQPPPADAKAHFEVPVAKRPSSPPLGQGFSAAKAAHPLPNGGEPPKPETIKANIAARTVTAVSVMDTMKVRGRGPWARIAVGELRAIVREGTRDAGIATRLLRLIPPGTDNGKSLSEVVHPKTFTEALQETQRDMVGLLSDV